MEEKIKNLTFIVILGFIIMFILIIGLYFKDGTTTTETTNKGTSGGSATSDTEYDVSEMNATIPNNTITTNISIFEYPNLFIPLPPCISITYVYLFLKSF